MINKTYEKVCARFSGLKEEIRNPVYLSITNGRVSVIHRSKHRTRTGCIYRKFWRMKID
jgi:hypothetical protein